MAAWLKNTSQVLTKVIRPPLAVNPPGWFIHEFTAITDIAPKIPLTAIGTPVQKCAQPGTAASRTGKSR